MGRVQLRRLPEYLERRRTLFARYAERLRDTPIHLPFTGSDRQAEISQTGIHILPTLLPPEADRSAVMVRLKESGIQTSIHYPPIHAFSAYRESRQHLPRVCPPAGRSSCAFTPKQKCSPSTR